MKRVSKIFAVLMTVLLIFSAVSVFAFADDTEITSITPTKEKKAAISEDKFLYYSASAGTATEYNNSEFIAKVKKMANGDAIVLLSDMHAEGHYVSMNVSGTAYIDFNGYRFSAHTDSTSKYFFQPTSGTTLRLYSSDSEHTTQIFVSATNQANGNETRMGLFDVRRSNTHVYLGDASNVPVFEKSGSTWAINKSKTVNADGDNIEYYGSELFTSYLNNQPNPQNASFNINGGTYYNVLSTGALIEIYSGTDININGAKFLCTAGGGVFQFHKSSKETSGGYMSAPADANLTVKNSFFYSSGSIMIDAYEAEADEKYSIKKSDIYFENCNFVSQMVVSNVSKGSPEFKNCCYSLSFFYDGINDIVKTNEREVITLASVSFHREVTSTVKKNDDGTETTVYAGTLLDSSFDVSYSTLPVTYTHRGCESDLHVNVTWIANGETVTEKWYKGENVYPISPQTPSSTDVYAYNYDPIIKPTSETGNITYTLKPHINFTLKANIALYADFTYNLYIPKDAADSELFNWARIDSLNADGSVYEIGATQAVSGGKSVKLEVAKDVFEEHYVLTQDISAFEGDREYQLVINVDDGFGGSFEHIQKFSIFDYADRVNAGNYTAEAKDLVNFTKTYIKAARNYATKEGTLPYPTETNSDLSAVVGTATSQKKATPSDAIKEVFYGMNITLDNSIKFSFYLNPDFTDTVTFHYPVNTKYKSVTITSSDCEIDESGYLRYDISMRAIDLRGRIVIDLASTATEEDYSYRLSNYVYSISGESETTKTLIDALWAYSLATYNYLKVADSDSPTVSINVAGNKVTADTYAIVATEPEGKAAQTLRDAIRAKTGETLEISAAEVPGKKSIYVTLTDPDRTYDFMVMVEGDDLVIKCGFASFIDDATVNFVEKNINPKNADINFNTGYRDDYYTNSVYYSDFGAYGIDMDALVAEYGTEFADISNWKRDNLTRIRPSLTNDFANIKAAHDFVNITGRHTVCAEDSAVYYISESLIGSTVSQIVIRTPVKWGNANFVIDDSDIPNYSIDGNTAHNLKRSQGSNHLFVFKSTYESINISDKQLIAKAIANGLNQDTTVIDLGLGYDAMIIPYNSSHNVYRRKGYGSWEGAAMKEVILIDENGVVSSDTPIMFDYGTNVDYFTVIRTDISDMTVEGGTFTTIASSLPQNNGSSYISRGIQIERSNTTLKNVKHVIIGEITVEEQTEGILGSAYQGFFSPANGANITLDGCVLQGRRCYAKPTGGTTGTYDFSGSLVANITLKNCTQSNFWVDDYANAVPEGTSGAKLSMSSSSVSGSAMHWGIGGTNYCKNMVYENSTLSRFDAHAGLYNGKIVNSTISGLEVVGNGELLLDNVRWFASNSSAAYNSIISLRADYGCTWTGDIILKDVDAYPYEGTNAYFGQNPFTTAVIYHTYSNWYFGYVCHFPNVIIDNLEYYSRRTGNIISANDMGQIELAVNEINKGTNADGTRKIVNSFVSEPNIHLDTTSKSSPYFEDVDKNKDGYVDGTNIKYDGSASNDGVKDTSSLVNRNPIVPPEFIKILNNKQGYDFTSKIKYYMTKTTFFDNTKIIIGTTDKDGNLTITETVTKKPEADDVVSPILPF